MLKRTRRRVTLAGGLAAVMVAAGLMAPAAGAPARSNAPNDPYFKKQWGLRRIDVLRAWTYSTGRGATIAVLDSGVDLGHPDLKKQLANSGIDFMHPDPKRGAADDAGHGTHVAGIALASTDNGTGVAGVAPQAELLPLKVCDETGTCSIAAVAEAIRFAADSGADVIHMSLGAPNAVGRAVETMDDYIDEAVDYAWKKGAVIVSSAGNDSTPLCGYPSYHPRVLCVGATDRHDGRTVYTNSDATMTANYLVAPGGISLTIDFGFHPFNTGCDDRIWSTFLRSSSETLCLKERGYAAISGSSMAAPFVSGVAALLASKGVTNEDIFERILSSTDDLGAPGRDPIFGYGRLNAGRAVAEAAKGAR